MVQLVVAPDAVVRFMGGEAVVHTAGGRHLATRDPALPALLGRLAVPTDGDAAVDGIAPAQRPGAVALLAELRAIGAVVPVTGAQPPGAAPGPPAEAQLELLADGVQRLAGTVAGFGEEADPRLAAVTGVPLSARLTTLVAALSALEGELRGLIPAYLDAQLRALGLDRDARHLRLHLGCGEARLEGWVNVDAAPAELALDLRWGLPFADGAADYVFMAHVFEHFYYPEEALAVLGEIRRVLAPGGRLRLVVPDIGQCLQAYAAGDDGFFADRAHTWTWCTPTRTPLEGFLAYAGAGPRASHFLAAHKYGYDFPTLAQALADAGFTGVERSGYMASADPVLRVDGASRVAAAESGGRHYSLFVEATR